MGACCSSASSDDEPKFTNPRDQERISGGKALEKTQMRQQAALSRFSLEETNHLALEAFRQCLIDDVPPDENEQCALLAVQIREMLEQCPFSIPEPAELF